MSHSFNKSIKIEGYRELIETISAVSLYLIPDTEVDL